jgi:hypothetical protein
MTRKFNAGDRVRVASGLGWVPRGLTVGKEYPVHYTEHYGERIVPFVNDDYHLDWQLDHVFELVEPAQPKAPTTEPSNMSVSIDKVGEVTRVEIVGTPTKAQLEAILAIIYG